MVISFEIADRRARTASVRELLQRRDSAQIGVTLISLSADAP
jgi:hypothetical protein